MSNPVTSLWPVRDAVAGPPQNRAEMVRAHLGHAQQLADLAVDDLLVKMTAAQRAAEEVATLKNALAPGLLDLAAKAAARYDVDVQQLQALQAKALRP